MNKIVLDTCCFFCYLYDEVGSQIVQDLFLKAQNNQIKLYVSRVNYCEIQYQIKRESNYQQILSLLELLPVEIIDTNEQICDYASNIKSKGKISLGDSFAIGTALFVGGEVATSDRHEFEAFEKDISILWIR